MGYGVRKKYDQVRASDLLAQACGHLGEYFCLAVEPSADLLILTYHSVMAAYDYNTHIEPPDENEDNCACFLTAPSLLVISNSLNIIHYKAENSKCILILILKIYLYAKECIPLTGEIRFLDLFWRLTLSLIEMPAVIQ